MNKSNTEDLTAQIRRCLQCAREAKTRRPVPRTEASDGAPHCPDKTGIIRFSETGTGAQKYRESYSDNGRCASGRYADAPSQHTGSTSYRI